MARFLIIRIFNGIVVLWLVSMAVFALFFIAPSNVARTLAGCFMKVPKRKAPEVLSLRGRFPNP